MYSGINAVFPRTGRGREHAVYHKISLLANGLLESQRRVRLRQSRRSRRAKGNRRAKHLRERGHWHSVERVMPLTQRKKHHVQRSRAWRVQLQRHVEDLAQMHDLDQLCDAAHMRPITLSWSWLFQSTSLARGTTPQQLEWARIVSVSIHIPRERDDFYVLLDSALNDVSIHIPRERDDDVVYEFCAANDVSIHIPRERDDRDR